jgi:16S rRNA (uracil1498-N3)-methyltransferase
MTRLYCPLKLVVGEAFALPAAAARHAQVLRLQPGAALELFDGQGGVWRGQVLAMGRQTVQAQALSRREAPARTPERAITLAVGMPANERMDWLVEKATELGVTRLVPLLTERSVLRLDGARAAKRLAHWQAIAVSACEQSGRDVLPEIAPVCSLKDWLAAQVSGSMTVSVAGSVAGAATDCRVRLSLAPDATPWQSLSLLPAQPLIAALGPEGGWSKTEERDLQQAGMLAVSLGAHVLRTETAALTVLARWATAAPSTSAPAQSPSRARSNPD